MPRWHFLFLSEKRKQNRKRLSAELIPTNKNNKNRGINASSLSYATLPIKPIHKIQQTQAWPTRRGVQIKSMPLPSSRLSIAVFFSVAGYSPVRTIKVRSKGVVVILFWVGAFNRS